MSERRPDQLGPLLADFRRAWEDDLRRLGEARARVADLEAEVAALTARRAVVCKECGGRRGSERWVRFAGEADIDAHGVWTPCSACHGTGAVWEEGDHDAS